jgi:hypothetical protein
LRIHSAKLTTAVCTTSCTLDRWDASSSPKNGSRSAIAWTASVDNRPEYCFSRRCRASGTFSINSSGERGSIGWLSCTPKSYADFLADSSKRVCR